MQLRQKPQKSLRTILMIWFLLFSVVPLAFITGYSLVKYEQALDQELSQRLTGNAREISVILNEFERTLTADNRLHVSDKNLVYHLSKNDIPSVRRIARSWMSSPLVHRIWVYNRDGRLEIALYRGPEGDIENKDNLEGGDVFLSDSFLKNSEGKDQRAFVYLHVDKQGVEKSLGDELDNNVDLVIFSPVATPSGSIVGYIEEVISLDAAFMENLKKRMNLEMFFLKEDTKKIVSSQPDLLDYSPGFFLEQQEGQDIFELPIRGEDYGVLLRPIKWGDSELILGLAANKSAGRAVLKNVNYAFFTVVGAIIILLIGLSIVTSKILLKPVYQLLDAIHSVDLDKDEKLEIPIRTDNELGLLTESFNQLFKRIFETQKDLKSKIKELEAANQQIRETQAKLVHTAKMASLGQLVAGIAHELNNPIGFIYSNMGHLRDYSNKLFSLVKTAEESPKNLEKEKQKIDYEYIREDLPKLIRSCEEGARRTRDIVLGLRNFSRLEESQIKEIDVHEGLDSTLNLLRGELKNRINIKKNYSELPSVLCYPSQLNQVFMNILSNAAHAIEGEGTITISTRKTDNGKVQISIQDTGKGMSQSTVEKIFDPFFTTKTLGSGTGLGLSISYGIVQKHGGDIKVSSKPGEGTEFTIELPAKAEK